MPTRTAATAFSRRCLGRGASSGRPSVRNAAAGRRGGVLYRRPGFCACPRSRLLRRLSWIPLVLRLLSFAAFPTSRPSRPYRRGSFVASPRRSGHVCGSRWRAPPAASPRRHCALCPRAESTFGAGVPRGRSGGWRRQRQGDGRRRAVFRGPGDGRPWRRRWSATHHRRTTVRRPPHAGRPITARSNRAATDRCTDGRR